MAWRDDSKTQSTASLFLFLDKWCCLELCAMYTSQSPKHCAASAQSKNKQNELLEVQLVKLWMKHSMVHIL